MNLAAQSSAPSMASQLSGAPQFQPLLSAMALSLGSCSDELGDLLERKPVAVGKQHEAKMLGCSQSATCGQATATVAVESEEAEVAA